MIRWLKRLGVVFAMASVIATSVCAAIVAPYVLDDLALDRAVRAVALDWRDFGEDRARERLLYELDHQGIGTWVADDDCDLLEGEDERTVRCRWTADIEVPVAEVVIPLSFASIAVVASSGDIL